MSVFIGPIIVLVTVWVMLWGDLSVANVLSGLAVAVGLLVVFPSGAKPARELSFHLFPVLRFTFYFFWKVIQSNLLLAREILRPRTRIRTGIIAVSLEGSTETFATMIANITALTPGTLTVELRSDPLVLYVHLFQPYDIDKARAEMERLKEMAGAAFGRAQQ